MTLLSTSRRPGTGQLTTTNIQNVEFYLMAEFSSQLMRFTAKDSLGTRRLPTLAYCTLNPSPFLFELRDISIEHPLALAAKSSSSSSLLASNTMSHNSDTYLILSYLLVPPRPPREYVVALHAVLIPRSIILPFEPALQCSTRKMLRIGSTCARGVGDYFVCLVSALHNDASIIK